MDTKKCHSSIRLHSPIERPGRNVKGLVGGAHLSVFLFPQIWFFQISKQRALFSGEAEEEANAGRTVPSHVCGIDFPTAPWLTFSCSSRTPPSPAVPRVYSCALWGRAAMANDWDNDGNMQAAASPSQGVRQIGCASRDSLLGRERREREREGECIKVSFTKVTTLKYRQLILRLCKFLPWGRWRYVSRSTQEGQNLKTLSEYSWLHPAIHVYAEHLPVDTARTNWLCSVSFTVSTLPTSIPDAGRPFCLMSCPSYLGSLVVREQPSGMVLGGCGNDHFTSSLRLLEYATRSPNSKRYNVMDDSKFWCASLSSL